LLGKFFLLCLPPFQELLSISLLNHSPPPSMTTSCCNHHSCCSWNKLSRSITEYLPWGKIAGLLPGGWDPWGHRAYILPTPRSSTIPSHTTQSRALYKRGAWRRCIY
jgi:hypothetical protein